MDDRTLQPGAESGTDETDMFLQEMEGVRPLKSDTKAPEKAQPTPTQAQLARREAAERSFELNPGKLASEYVELVEPLDIIDFKRDGVQNGVWRCLKRGDYEVQARLDLQHCRLEEAKRQLYEFIRDCQRLDLRTVLVHHGRGEKSTPPALIKSYTAKWLTQIPEVLAYHSAQKAHGATAAVYVLIQKSEREKQRNRERHKGK